MVMSIYRRMSESQFDHFLQVINFGIFQSSPRSYKEVIQNHYAKSLVSEDPTSLFERGSLAICPAANPLYFGVQNSKGKSTMC
jgi:hypothetical protein